MEGSMDSVIDAVQRFQTALASQAMRAWFDADLTMPQARALQTIHRMGRASGRQLATTLHVSPSAVVALCDRLESQGYLHRVPDATDRRITWFQLTHTGTELAGGPHTAARNRLAPAVAKLSDADRDNLARILTELADALGGPTT
jgi:DNA-binding MarR family transcriptional regulator